MLVRPAQHDARGLGRRDRDVLGNGDEDGVRVPELEVEAVCGRLDGVRAANRGRAERGRAREEQTGRDGFDGRAVSDADKADRESVSFRNTTHGVPDERAHEAPARLLVLDARVGDAHDEPAVGLGAGRSELDERRNGERVRAAWASDGHGAGAICPASSGDGGEVERDAGGDGYGKRPDM